MNYGDLWLHVPDHNPSLLGEVLHLWSLHLAVREHSSEGSPLLPIDNKASACRWIVRFVEVGCRTSIYTIWYRSKQRGGNHVQELYDTCRISPLKLGLRLPWRMRMSRETQYRNCLARHLCIPVGILFYVENNAACKECMYNSQRPEPFQKKVTSIREWESRASEMEITHNENIRIRSDCIPEG